MIGSGSAAKFNPAFAICASTVIDSNNTANLLFRVAVAVFTAAPILLITNLNVVLCVVAVRNARSHAQQGCKALLTISLLSGIYIASWVPFSIYVIGKVEVLGTAGVHCIYLNTFSNPILYTLTNQRFGNYVREMVKSVLCWKPWVVPRSASVPSYVVEDRGVFPHTVVCSSSIEQLDSQV